MRFIWVAPIVAGEDEVLPDALMNMLELEGRVTLLRSHRDLRPLYAAADVLAHPSYREGVPRVLMEAAAMGLPLSHPTFQDAERSFRMGLRRCCARLGILWPLPRR